MDQQEHIGTRLKNWIADKGLTAIAFAEEVNIQRSALSHIFSGRNKPSVDVLVKMKSKFPELSLEWLIIGEFPDKTNDKDATKDVDIQDSVKSKFTDVNILNEQSELQQDKTHNIAVIKSIKENPKLIRIIELYSDNSFKSYDS